MRLGTDQTFLGGILNLETGRKLVENDERGDIPKSTRTEVNIVVVAELVKNDLQPYKKL